ncbi:ComF family protein [Spirochaetota bacterium]
MMKKIFINILNLLFPGECYFCHKELNASDYAAICLKCLVKISKHSYKRTCDFCAHPLNDAGECPACISTGKRDFVFKANKSLSYNEDDFQKLIYDYKFKKLQSFSRPISELCIRRYTEYFKGFDFLVPVPLNKSRKLEREFCQVSRVADEIGKRLAMPVVYAIKKRDSDLKAQHDKSLDERRSTVHKDFYFLKKYIPMLRSKRLLLMDDIFTSGSTLNACAHIIKEHVHTEIYTFTFARSVLK